MFDRIEGFNTQKQLTMSPSKALSGSKALRLTFKYYTTTEIKLRSSLTAESNIIKSCVTNIINILKSLWLIK